MNLLHSVAENTDKNSKYHTFSICFKQKSSQNEFERSENSDVLVSMCKYFTDYGLN